MSKVVERIRQIGPHPVTLGRYTVHHVSSRARLRRLRRSYESAVAIPPAGCGLRAPEVTLTTFPRLPAALRSAAERLRTEAESALRHETDLLGSGPAALGQDIDWSTDFKSGYRWPLAFYQDVDVTRLDDSSDAKVPWELSRGHHLLTLARAAWIWEDERFATEVERQLQHWIDANPPGLGINWVNPMEVAIRSVNWLWAIGTLEGRRPLDPGVRGVVTRSLQSHGRHIASNLEGSPWLRSNHYLADVLGLVALGACLPGDPMAPTWLSTGRRALEKEIRAQVHADGLAFEASLSYHALVLEMFLLGRHLCRFAGHPLSQRFDDRLKAMLVAIASIRHPDGRLPQIGDADSGRILPAGVDRPPTADHLLWLGAADLGEGAPLAGPPHEEVAWSLGLDAWRRLSGSTQVSPAKRRSFPEGGIFVLGDLPLHLVVRCGDVGQNGNGGHAHNDMLSFELSLDGVPVVVDPGTFTYTADPGARNAFRATASHNTVVVAGEEINPIDPARLFELAQVARFDILADEPRRFIAEHDGYARLPVATIHRRSFELASGVVAVEDELRGHGAQDAEFRLHFATGVDVLPIDAMRFRVALGAVTAMVEVWGVDEALLEEGWVSPSFGVRQRATVLKASIAGALPLRFGCTIGKQGAFDEP